MYKDLEKKKKWYRKYYLKHKKYFEIKRYKNGIHIEVLRRFGRDPKIIYERDGWKCVICWSKEDLTIDHIDGNGRYSEHPNNDIENLRTLCRSCHGREDQKRARNWKDLPESSREKILNNLKYTK
jgi:5-methylcytosine-specific restriction endonuclease McrA